MHLSSVTTSPRRSLWSRITGWLFRRPPEDHDLVYLNRREVRRLIDERARRDFGMSGAEFVAAFDRGELRDSALAQHLMLIAGERADAQPQRGASAV